MTKFRILTVCIGNVCRSPIAERMLRAKFEAAGLATYVVGSAGVGAMVGRGMDPSSAKQLHALGGSSQGFVSRQVSASMLRDAGLVLTATTSIRRRVLEEEPSALRRTFTWREFAALITGVDADGPAALVAEAARRRGLLVGQDIDTPDPIGRDAGVHADVARMIADAVETIAGALIAVSGVH